MSENLNTRTILKAILTNIDAGQKKFLIWGVNETCLDVVRDLEANGLIGYIAGIVDSSNFGSKLSHFVISSPENVSQFDFDTLVITNDANKESTLLEFSRLDNRLPKVIVAGIGHLEFIDPTFQAILKSCLVKPKAGGYQNMLIHIYQSLVYLVSNNKKGAVAEFGVFRGGTTAFIAKTLESLGASTKIYGFDTFEGFPDRKSVLDQFSENEYEKTDYETVRRYLEPYNVELIRGDISDTYTRIKDIPLIFSFFDTDNYSPTRDALARCYDQTVNGGIIGFDHYYCDEKWLYTIGERIAAKQILQQKKMLNLHGTGIFLKF